MPWRTALSGNKSENTFHFNDSLFNQRLALARDLVDDDHAAWWSSDSITALQPHHLDSLDDTWFVLSEPTARRIFYGRYFPETNTYTIKYSFTMSDSHAIALPPSETSDTVTLFARAVYFGDRYFDHLLDSLMLDFPFNHYIRRNPDNTFILRYLPAGTGNLCAYGTEIILQLAETGDSLLSTTLTGNELKYVEFSNTPEALELDNTFDEVPSIGNIFFTLSFIREFPVISIINQESISIARMSETDTSGRVSWEHVQRQ